MDQSALYVAKPTVAASELNGGAVLLDLDQSQYFGLNPVGETVWNQLSKASSLEQLCDAVCDQFEVPRAVCLKDVDKLLSQLLERGLIERHDAPEI